MKKNYMKPSLLSETFVTENIMTDLTVNKEIALSQTFNAYVDGVATRIDSIPVDNITTISIGDFNL